MVICFCGDTEYRFTHRFPPKDAAIEGVGKDTGEKKRTLVIVIAQIIVVNCGSVCTEVSD